MLSSHYIKGKVWLCVRMINDGIFKLTEILRSKILFKVEVYIICGKLEPKIVK